MTTSSQNLPSCLPALRNAFMPDDLPVTLTYTRKGRRVLRLTDDDGVELGDPLREFVDDVLGTLDASAGPFNVVEAHGVIRPNDKSGTVVGLAPLMDLLGEMREMAMVPGLSGQQLIVTIEVARVAEWPGATTITAAPRVAFAHKGPSVPEALDAAIAVYGHQVAELMRDVAAGPLGAWCIDSGLTRLVLQAHIAVPRQIRA